MKQLYKTVLRQSCMILIISGVLICTQACDESNSASTDCVSDAACLAGNEDSSQADLNDNSSQHDSTLLPSTIGAAAPSFELANFQPTGERAGETFGLDHFKGKPTLVTLWASW
jgi:hypothetical protein